jgi:hypothetical protein
MSCLPASTAFSWSLAERAYLGRTPAYDGRRALSFHSKQARRAILGENVARAYTRAPAPHPALSPEGRGRGREITRCGRRWRGRAPLGGEPLPRSGQRWDFNRRAETPAAVIWCERRTADVPLRALWANKPEYSRRPPDIVPRRASQPHVSVNLECAKRLRSRCTPRTSD